MHPLRGICTRIPRILSFVAFTLIASSARVSAQSGRVDFGSERWNLASAEVVERFGRTCLSGAAVLEDVDFQDGVIEVDVAVNGSRSYPGVVFRLQDEGNYERFYIRPHRAGLYPDALQYTPVINGVAGWQLYNGDGFTAGAEIPADAWMHLKLEIAGSQARVYLDSEQPALVVPELKHGVSNGAIGVLGPKNGTACFSNFAYRVDDTLSFDPPPTAETPAGTIRDWEISRSFKAAQADRSKYPRFYAIFLGEWQKATPEPSGLVDVARYVQREAPDPELVLARTFVNSDKRRPITLTFGYSDEVDIFLNHQKVFSGKSGYRYRDPSFLGVVGPFDAINLMLEKGRNEIFLIVTETFGGWGFMARADRELEPPLKDHQRLTKVWETPKDFLTPESVLYDPRHEILYVSSFDVNYGATQEHTGYISKVTLDGQIETLKWVSDLDAPTGMGIHDDRLYVTERGYLTEIDIDRGEVVERYAIEGSEFLNDLAIDDDGNIYMTDTRPSAHPDSRIYRFNNGRVEEWVNEGIIQANGLYVYGDKLIVGNTGDGVLKAVGLSDRRIENIACLGAGVLDGIRVDNDGDYLVSHWEGQVYSVSPAGRVVQVLDVMPDGVNTADFEFVREQDLLLVPTFLDNRVIAYRLSPSK